MFNSSILYTWKFYIISEAMNVLILQCVFMSVINFWHSKNILIFNFGGGFWFHIRYSRDLRWSKVKKTSRFPVTSFLDNQEKWMGILTINKFWTKSTS